MGISKSERFVAHRQSKEEYTMETEHNNRRKTGFNFEVSSYSVPYGVSIVITAITHIPQGSNGPGSSGGIATGYGLDGPGIESRWGA